MIFDLEEPWHWPLCAKKISLRSEMAAVKGLVEQAEAAEATARPNDASREVAEADAACGHHACGTAKGTLMAAATDS
jgi:hypothetical protein